MFLSRSFQRLAFSVKKEAFFWNDVNPRVVEAQYAVRGLVPTFANNIKTELLAGSTRSSQSI